MPFTEGTGRTSRRRRRLCLQSSGSTDAGTRTHGTYFGKVNMSTILRGVPDCTYGGDKCVHMTTGVEPPETGPHGTLRKGADGLVGCRGAVQPRAHGNAKRLIEDRPGEGDASGIKPERDDSSTGFQVAEHADPIDLSQLVRQGPRQW